MPKKIPMRTCIGCGENKSKKELVRIVRTPEGELHLDRTGRANGRGAYLCRKEACLEQAKKRHALGRAFREEIPSGAYHVLEQEMHGLLHSGTEGT